METEQLLILMQHGDSLFPSGANTISSGIETLVSEDRITSAAEVQSFVQSQLNNRWKNFERPALLAVFHQAGDLNAVADIDALIDTQTLSAESRNASIRVGKALLDVHIKLNTKSANEYKELIHQSSAYGHCIIVQGLMWHALGLSERSVSSISAYVFCNALVSAALRLGVIGHIAAQQILTDIVSTVKLIEAEPPLGIDKICMFTPEQEIAVMRHSDLSCRLFTN